MTNAQRKINHRVGNLKSYHRNKSEEAKCAPLLCSCGCGAKVKDGRISIHGHNRRIRPFESLYNNFIAIAKIEGKVNTLSFKDFLTFTNTVECHYCRGVIEWFPYYNVKYDAQKHRRYNLDRKDNTKGYSKKNCVVCCGFCNMTKGNRFTYTAFLEVGTLIKSMRERGML